MPKGINSKIEKRMKNGFCFVARGLRGEERNDLALCCQSINMLLLNDVITRGWWLPTSGENTDEELWAQLWPRTEWFWGEPPR